MYDVIYMKIHLEMIQHILLSANACLHQWIICIYIYIQYIYIYMYRIYTIYLI